MIKLDVIGHVPADLTSQPWEDGWDTIHGLASAVREGVLDPDSRVEGELRVSVASRSEVKMVNERFGEVVKTDENLQQFEDREVTRIVAEKMNGGALMSKSAWGNVTSIGTNFQNSEIVSFDELIDTKVANNISQKAFADCSKLETITIPSTSLDFNGSPIRNCSSLKKIIAPNLVSLRGEFFEGIPSNCVVLMPKLEGDLHFTFPGNDQRLDFFGLPSIKTIASWVFVYNTCGVGTWDLGKNLTSFGDTGLFYNNASITNGIFRATNPPTVGFSSSLNAISKIFVPTSSVSSYKSYDSWSSHSSKIFAIGGSEWQTAMRTLATQYAAEYAGWSAEQIATADYSDPYIDYRIFGLEPPTE